MSHTNENNNKQIDGKIGTGPLLGLFLIIVGGFWVLSNTGIIEFRFYAWWPLILIGVGLLSIGGAKGKDAFFGWLIFLLGVYFFLSKNHLIEPVYFRKYWPVILILVGLYFIFGRDKNGRSGGVSDDNIVTGSDINEVAVFNEVERKVKSDNFKGGSVTSIFDDINLDLTECKLSPNGANISGTSIFDDIIIRVPGDMPVKVRSTSIFGSVKNRTENPVPTDKQYLNITVTAIFGDIKIIN